MTTKPTASEKAFALGLDRLATKLGLCYRPPNDNDHRYERTGWLMVRAGLVMIEHGDKAHALAADWAARGYPAGTTDDPKVPGGHDLGKLNSVESASQQSDEWEQRRDQLALLRRLLDDNAKDVESQITDTIRVRPNEGRRDSLIPCGNPRTDAEGELVCTIRVTGIGEDRLKDGRCPRCYKFRQRNGLEWNPRLDTGRQGLSPP